MVRIRNNKKKVDIVNDHLGQVAIDKFNEVMTLFGHMTLVNEFVETLKVNPRIQNKFTNLLIDLFEMGYVFKNKFLHRLFYMIKRIDYGEHDEYYSYDNKEKYMYRCYLFSTNLTHIKFMKLFFSKVVLNNRDIVRNKNINYIDKLLEYNYKFTQIQIKSICGSKHKNYSKFGYEKTNFLSESIIVYVIMKVSLNEKIDDMIFGNWIELVKNSGELSFYYFESCYNNFIIKDKNNVNKDNCELLLVSLFYNLLNSGNNNDALFNFISKSSNRYDFIDALFIKYLYKDTLANIFNENDIFSSHLEHLFNIVNNNGYVVDIDFLNKLLLNSQWCDIHVKNNEYDHIRKYVVMKKCKGIIGGNIIINFGGDTFIDVCSGQYNGKINTVDLFTIFSIVPNVDTLNIALESGYVDVVMKLVENWGFIIRDECLGISIKSKNVKMIEYVLNCGVTIDSGIIEMLFGANKNKFINKNGYSMMNRKRMMNNKIRKIKRNRKLTAGQKKEKIKKINAYVPRDDIMNVVELLIKYGMNVDLSVVGLLLSYDKCLGNLERFGISYDEDLYFECYVNGCYPTEYMNKFIMGQDVLSMRTLLKRDVSGNKVKEFLKNNNMKLDNYAVEYGLIYGNKYVESLMNKIYYIPKDHMMYKKAFCVNNNYYYSYKYDVKKFRDYVKDNMVNKDMMVATISI